MLRTLDLMINCRRKQVPVCRVAAYIKRLLALAFFVSSCGAASILLCIRSFFIVSFCCFHLLTYFRQFFFHVFISL